MPADAIANFHPRDFFTLAPEIVLAVWGLVVLAADLGPLRRRSPAERMRATSRIAMAGALAALFASVVAMLIRFDLFGLQESINFSRIDYMSNPDPLLFFGTISGDILTDLFNLLFTGTLALVVWMSTVWAFTENWGEYFALLLWSTVGMMLQRE